LPRLRPTRLTLHDFLPYRLSLAANAVSALLAEAYEGVGLRPQEWRVLAILGEGGEALTQQEVVGRTKMDKVSVSRAAQALEARGWLRRSPDREDGRSLRIRLTAAGKRGYESLVPLVLEREERLVAGLSPREISELRGLLARLEAAAEGSRSR
jgi:DNA-binding MarR family transcriptional regulator